jgi:hypothetical protein
VIFCILLTIFVSDVFGFSPRHPTPQSTDTPDPLGYRLEDGKPVTFVGRNKGLFCSPNCPDLFWGPHSLPFSGQRGHLLENKVAGFVWKCSYSDTPSWCGVQFDAFCPLCKHTSISVLAVRSDTKFYART